MAVSAPCAAHKIPKYYIQGEFVPQGRGLRRAKKGEKGLFKCTLWLPPPPPLTPQLTASHWFDFGT